MSRREHIKAGSISSASRARNIVAAFQSSLQDKHTPTYHVISYKPINAVNIRVKYTAPIWNDEPQIAIISRYTPGLVGDRTETWCARPADKGREIVRFLVDSFTGEYEKVL